MEEYIHFMHKFYFCCCIFELVKLSLFLNLKKKKYKMWTDYICKDSFYSHVIYTNEIIKEKGLCMNMYYYLKKKVERNYFEFLSNANHNDKFIMSNSRTFKNFKSRLLD